MRTKRNDNAKSLRTPRNAFFVNFVPWCLCVVLLLPAGAAAAVPLSFPARHDHAVGSCRGTLVFSSDEIRYEGARHAARWPYGEIQELRLLDTGRVRILTYEDRGKLRLGADRAFNFEVDGGLKEAATLLTQKLDQRLVVGFAQRPEKVLAEFRVKHLRPLRGDEGTLTFGEDTIVFQSQEKGESRTWRYSDIENISSSDSLHLTLTTYEQQKFHYATRRAFNFQLKQPLPEETYNALWQRLNRPRNLEIFEKLRADLDQKAEAASELPVHADEAVATAAQQISTAREQAGMPAGIPVPLYIPYAAFRNPYVPMMERILGEEGLPVDLISIAKVESGFNRFALSPKNARGLWQFIPHTARRFGLRVDGRTDERVDPEKSTRAAARYLKELYGRFGDWKLALAGYNAGEKRVESALLRAGTSDFTRLAYLLPRETQNYVPAVLALWDRPVTAATLAGPAARGQGGRAWTPAPLRLFAPAALIGIGQ